MDEDLPAKVIYRVTLKTGETGNFSNDNNYDDYERRLISGIYGILTTENNTPITAENVHHIDALVDTKSCAHCGHQNDWKMAGSRVCSECGKRTWIPAVETNGNT